MATNWIVETIASAVSETGTKTANLADGNNFNITDSSGSEIIFKVLNDSSDYYSMAIYGHEGQPAKFYLAADNGDDQADAWLWQVADGGTMSWRHVHLVRETHKEIHMLILQCLLTLVVILQH